MGVVYLGHDARLERPVAIKVLREGLRTGAERLEREARVLAKLAHPNVVTIHEVGEDGEHAFIAMEYVHGTTLREWMNEVHSIEERTDIVVQAAAGLAAAHALGLVHRDFKPDNAMVGEDGRLRLLDFGLASTPLAENLLITGPSKRGWSRITETGAVLGTPAYLAPELLRGARPSAASDQFSLCCAGWEVLCGQHPISDGSFVEVQPSPMVPPHVVAALRRGLADDPTARHSSVEALRDALRPTSATTNATTSQGRRKLAIALGVAALATVVAVAGRAWIAERQPVSRVAADRAARAANACGASLRGALIIALALCVSPAGALAESSEKDAALILMLDAYADGATDSTITDIRG
ncbi:MAG: serine/threonine protein kinase, partial [Nannocystaceae bacterium]|nr:serine/threonine protein kinase [Nannocystaceae bacterium]